MKKFAAFMVIAGMLGLCSAEVFAADAANEFFEAYEQTTEVTHGIFEHISETFSAEATEGYALEKEIDTLVTHAEMLEKLADAMGKQESAEEARQMAVYLKRAKESLQSEHETHALTMHLARYYLHFNNCAMVNTLVLKNLLKEHVAEMKTAVAEGDMHEIEHLAEHQHLHADQMYYAAMMFGKKVWQKFSLQIKTSSDEIFAAALDGDKAVIEAKLEELEKSVDLLLRIVKE